MRPLHSDRLTMRVVAEADEAFYRALYTDTQVMRHIGEPLTDEAAGAAFAKTCRLNRDTAFRYRLWVMSLTGDGTDIGLLGLRRVEGGGKVGSTQAGTCWGEMGAMLLPSAQGRGYAAEALRALIDYAFQATDAQWLFTRHRNENGLATGLMRKLRFQKDPDSAQCRFELSRARWEAAHREA